jgi:hypothetical protein
VHESGGDDELGADFDDLSDDESELTEDFVATQSPEANGESESNGADGEQTSTHSRSLSAAQRAIPTWDDAIGFIVDSNLQNRSQRRPPSRSDSRGSSSRGRPRGRRNS